MGNMNVLIKYQPAYEAYIKFTALKKLNPEQFAIEYLSMVLERFINAYHGKPCMQKSMKSSDAEKILLGQKKLLPVTGDQREESFPVHVKYGLGDETIPFNDFSGAKSKEEWQHGIVFIASGFLASDMDDTLIVTMIYLGNAFLLKEDEIDKLLAGQMTT